jgi:hypothetical protein
MWQTMIFGAAKSAADTASPSSTGGIAPGRPSRLSLEQEQVEGRRLAHLAQLIRRARQPVCPINGILALLPFGMIQGGELDASGVKRAIRSDLAALQKTLLLICPVNALVTGMEEESGFQELVRRVGRSKADGQRFGKGFEVYNVPLEERIEALTRHACGAFEDWIYELFREPDSLSKPGNTKLYSLLCKVRRAQEPLVKTLVGGFACDLDGDPAPDAFRFGGCYFAGTGASDDRRAFVHAVVIGKFQKARVEEEDEELQWTDQALKQADRYHLASQIILALDLVLLLVLAGEFFVWIRNQL